VVEGVNCGSDLALCLTQASSHSYAMSNLPRYYGWTTDGMLQSDFLLVCPFRCARVLRPAYP